MTHEEYKKHEEYVFDYLLKKYSWQISTTPHFALIDGFATMNNEVTHIIEFKSRNESYQSLLRFETYLISYDKLVNGVKMSQMMMVPFILIVYCNRDKTVLGIEIGDQNGIHVPHQIKETMTQQNIDGGQVVRKNAFIDIDNFYIL